MKKIIVLLVLCLTVGALAACTNDTETETDTTTATESATESATETETTTDSEVPANAYLFTVVLGDTDQPAKGVQVQLCRGEEFCLMPSATDAEGKVIYSLSNNERDVYDVHIMEDSLPKGYTFDNASVKTSADTVEYTLTLVKE